MTQSIVFLAASPSDASRSAFVAHIVASEAERAGYHPAFFSLRDFEPADILFGRSAAPSIVRFVEATKAAAAFVLATPVYKATYAGALKAIVDLIPPDVLVEKPALGISTARVATHAIGVNQAYRALFGFFRARAQDGLFVGDDELKFAEGGGVLSIDAEQRVRKAARSLIQTINEAAQGGPQP
jgi:FMN reductase